MHNRLWRSKGVLLVIEPQHAQMLVVLATLFEPVPSRATELIA
jgi:hypothetical protein